MLRTGLAKDDSSQFRPQSDVSLVRTVQTKLTGTLMSVARGAQIYGESEPADYFYKVVSGVVRAYSVLVDGRRQIAAFYLPGEVFGIEAGHDYAFSTEAVTTTRLHAIRLTAALSLAARDKDIAQELWTLRGRELHRAQTHNLLLVKKAPERVASFLLEMAERIQSDDDVELPMSRQDIADYLGLTIETVSRMLTRLEKLSAIALPSSKHVVLRDHEALKRLNS